MQQINRTLAILAAALSLTATGASQREQAPVDPAQINQAIDRGVQHLLATQTLEGRWFWQDAALRSFTPLGRPGATALALHALLKSGVDKDHLAIRRGIAGLEHAKVTQTYDACCLILALLARDPELHREWIGRLVGQLVKEQQGGIWGYPSNPGDLSNTQFAALALWAAERAGHPVGQTTWVDLAEALPRYASRRGGYVYQAGGRAKPTPSMTAAGLMCVFVCRRTLAEELQRDPDLREALQRTESKSLQWLGKQFQAKGFKKLREDGLGYYLYGVERLGAVSGQHTLGDAKEPWYSVGARFLVDEQQDDGSWSHLYAGSTGTSFALLFLTRATGPSTPQRSWIDTPPKPGDLAAQDPAAQDPDAPWLEELARDATRNLLPASGVTASASSTHKKCRPNLATDRDRLTSWQSTNSDTRPRLKLTLLHPVRTDTVKIGEAYSPEDAPNPIAHAPLLLVSINGGKPVEVKMPQHPLQRGTLTLPETTRITDILITFPARTPAADGTERVGISEVELQRQR